MEERPPKILYLGNRPLFRFMDAIYLPARPYQLDPGSVRELCELRLRILSEISDQSLRLRVASSLISVVGSLAANDSTILDFGTGSGLLANLLCDAGVGARIAGVDMSFESLARSNLRAKTVLAAPEGPLPFKTASIGIVASLFVFHFRLPHSMRNDLLRVINSKGFLVGNVYGPDVLLYENEMKMSGWRLCLVSEIIGAVGHRVDVWHSVAGACPRSSPACGSTLGLSPEQELPHIQPD